MFDGPLFLAVDGETAATVAGWFPTLRPPSSASLAGWAAAHARTYDGAVFKPYPYQRAILDAMADPSVSLVTVMKSARVGYTQMLSAVIGYYIAHKPSRIMLVQPTLEDAEDYSKDTIDLLPEWPVLEPLLSDLGARKRGDTIKRKSFPGGSLKITGANSPRAFRRIDLDLILFDEVDGYPATAGAEGDQIALGRKRLQQSLHPLAVIGSTPTIEGQSKVADWFARGTMERFHVPCPQCGEFQVLRWGDGTGAGIRWRNDDPDTAHYVCVNGCVIEESHKLEMVEAGRWVAERPEVTGHRSFHIWSAYCPLAGAAWRYLVAEFLDARKDRNKLQVFTNTVLGETWVDRGEAPDWQRLYDRREPWAPGTVPRGGLFLTAGADVQRDRIEISVWAWGRGKESWLIDHRVLPGDPFGRMVWQALAAVLAETFRHESGAELTIIMTAIDAGDGVTHEVVKSWARTAGPRVMAIKGSSQALAPILGTPSSAEINFRGKRIGNGVRLWPVGSSTAKAELYGWLRQPKPTAESGEPFPPGFVHLPDFIGEEYCRQLVAEHLVRRGVKGRQVSVWEPLRDRNEALDCRNYARAAAVRQGLDRMGDADFEALEAQLADMPAPPPLRMAPPPDTQESLFDRPTPAVAPVSRPSTAPAAPPPRPLPAPHPAPAAAPAGTSVITVRKSRYAFG